MDINDKGRAQEMKVKGIAIAIMPEFIRRKLGDTVCAKGLGRLPMHGRIYRIGGQTYRSLPS